MLPFLHITWYYIIILAVIVAIYNQDFTIYNSQIDNKEAIPTYIPSVNSLDGLTILQNKSVLLPNGTIHTGELIIQRNH